MIKLMKMQIEALIAKAKPVLLAREKKAFAAAMRDPKIKELVRAAVEAEKQQTAASKASMKADVALTDALAKLVKPKVGLIQGNSGKVAFHDSNWSHPVDNDLRNRILLLSLDAKDIADMDELFKKLVG